MNRKLFIPYLINNFRFQFIINIINYIILLYCICIFRIHIHQHHIKMTTHTVPIKYIPSELNISDRKKQTKMLIRSRKMYKNKKYYTRKQLKSYKNKTSNHMLNARKMYKIENIRPDNELSNKTGCSIAALRKIVKKGEGAYYSSGSRPNQTPQSWGYARLASAITGGKAAAIDYDILDKGCDHSKRAFVLANKSRRNYKLTHTKHVKLNY